MNQHTKEVVKKVVYSTVEWLDTAVPPVSTFLIRRWCRLRDINDLHIPDTFHYDPLGPYVTLYTKRPSFYKKFIARYTFDEEGIPQLRIDGTAHYAPVLLAQFGLMEYGYYLDTREAFHRENCLKAAQKLLSLQDERGGWPHTFDHYRSAVGDTLKAGWYSAMAQGQAVSLFARANALEPNEAYRVAAHRALAILETPVKDGGVCAKLGDLDFYEEYPTTPSSYTLNGFIFCVMGLYDGAQVFHDEQAEAMFQKVVRTIEAILPLYDDPQVTPYDLSHLTNAPKIRWRDRKYHILHVKLLQALNDIAPNQVFGFYIEKWGKNWR